MVAFDNLEDIFQTIRDHNEYSKALVTLATTFGTFLILFYTIKILFSLIQGLRLYFIHQLCCQVDFKRKYGQWAVISGSTDGIGLAMARELAQRGMSIVVIGRNEDKLANTKASLQGETNAGEIVTVKIDLADSSKENFDRIRSQIDPDNRDIGILINNAGLAPSIFKRFNKYDMDYIRYMTNLNILAPLHLTRMIMPGMISRGRGMVVNVSSLFGAIIGPYACVYALTKTFLNAFSRQLQAEYSSHPIDIINLTPGGVHTKLFSDAIRLSKPTPFNPTPEDFARSAVNALSAGINNYSGTMIHGLLCKISVLFDELGLVSLFATLNLRIYTRQYEISPVPKRKNQQNMNIVASGGDTNSQEAVAMRSDSNL